MPSNIWKRFSRAKEAELYVFPDASELKTESVEQAPPSEEEGLEAGREEEEEQENTLEEPELVSEPAPQDPVSFAQVQAEALLRDARQQAKELLAQAREEAEEEAEQIRRTAREDGYRAGYEAGVQKALQEGMEARERQATELAGQVQKYLDQAAAALDRQLDDNVDELRDLAIAIAEKVVCISLKSSTEVISRMVQTAIDKRKRREWVHIYIAECDAKRMGQVPATLTAALRGLSDRVRIIPMANDESGTCIIEMPDEIVDASAATQLGNIRGLLMDTPSADLSGDYFQSRNIP